MASARTNDDITPAELVTAVRTHALAHAEDGWDIITEATSDAELVKMFGAVRTAAGAIAKVGKFVALKAEQQQAIDSQVTGKSTAAKTTAAKQQPAKPQPPVKAKAVPDPAWTQIPPAPKTPNFWQGHGYTLAYRNQGGGWDVHPGTHDSKATLADSTPLFHARLAADAKAWVAEHPVTDTPAAKPAAKRTARKAPGKAAPTA